MVVVPILPAHNANHLIADFRPHQSIQRHIILGYILKLRPQFSQRSQQKHHCMFCYCIGRIERNIRCLQSIFFHGCKIKMIIAGRTGHYIFHSHFTDLLPEDISIILERRERKPSQPLNFSTFSSVGGQSKSTNSISPLYFFTLSANLAAPPLSELNIPTFIPDTFLIITYAYFSLLLAALTSITSR